MMGVRGVCGGASGGARHPAACVPVSSPRACERECV